MRHTVGVSDMIVSSSAGDIIVTHALGSCVGIAVHDPEALVGGILHYMLPVSSVDRKKAEKSPFMFGDTGIPALFEEMYRQGARKENLRVVMAGGAKVFEESDFFDIGNRNVVIARKLLWKNRVMISREHVGGHIPRTLYLDIGTGSTWLSSQGRRIEL